MSVKYRVPALHPNVATVFQIYPPAVRRCLMAIRKLIFETASATEGVCPLTETLKWGEPAYLTEATKSGSTVRIGWKKSAPGQYAVYFNCQTGLVDTFRALMPETFTYQGNRAIVFETDDTVPVDALAVCIAHALSYHRNKKKMATR